MRRVYQYVIVVVVVVLAFGLAYIVFFPHAVAGSSHLVAGGRTISLEVVETPAAREQGLSGRASLADNEGMLFVFPRSDIYPFWMKDMRFDLDILWISNGIVVDEVTLPAPTPGATIPTYRPTAAADQVLELAAGQAAELGLNLGAEVTITR